MQDLANESDSDYNNCACTNNNLGDDCPCSCSSAIWSRVDCACSRSSVMCTCACCRKACSCNSCSCSDAYGSKNLPSYDAVHPNTQDDDIVESTNPGKRKYDWLVHQPINPSVAEAVASAGRAWNRARARVGFRMHSGADKTQPGELRSRNALALAYEPAFPAAAPQAAPLPHTTGPAGSETRSHCTWCSPRNTLRSMHNVMTLIHKST